jgi:hypothetical protein
MDPHDIAPALVGSVQARNLALATLAFGVSFWAAVVRTPGERRRSAGSHVGCERRHE